MIPLAGLYQAIELTRLTIALRYLISKQKRRWSRSRRRDFRREFRQVTGIAAAAQRRKRARNYLLILEERNRPCADCGLFYGSERMEFDHVPELGEKTESPCKLVGKRNRLRAEMAKCQIVCCRCHEKREIARGRTHSGGARPCPNESLPGGCRAPIEGVSP